VNQEPAVLVQALSKRYKLYAAPWHRAVEWVTGGRRRMHEEFWALRDVSFEVHRGECLGIIGRNGSGKSTLLKILAGASVPTAGLHRTNGRMLALLELGAGFNGVLTGRQNVVASAELLGFPPGYAAARISDIEAFAEIGEHFDRPVRTYSSGMFVRLAFSTFMFLEPDVLVVDEALSVGDVFFQQKCFDAVRRMRANGTTLLYVSHDMPSVSNLCDRVLLLDHGKPLFLGDPDEAIAHYYAAITGRPSTPSMSAVVPTKLTADSDFAAAADQIVRESILRGSDRRTSGGAFEITAARVIDESGRPIQRVESLETLEFQLLARARDFVARPNIGLEIYDRFNQLVYAVSALNLDQPLPALHGGTELIASFRVRFSLQPGQYTFVLVTADQSGMVDPNTGVYHDRHHKLGPIDVTWSRPMLRFYGMTALETFYSVRMNGDAATGTDRVAPAQAGTQVG